MFVLLFKNGNDDAKRNSFDKYYMSVEEIKDFNTLIDNTPFFDQPVKTKKKNRKLIEMSRNDAYRTGSLLDYLYHQKYYKLIGIDLPRQTNINISRFACNTRVIVDANSNPLVSNVKLLYQKSNINSASKQTNIASSINYSNGNSIRW